ncbi:MAG: potassium transporter TrkG, partial [Oscillospiraceae bacterium]|nr:potassium transporter TrkG [Oscillospiraceae bacterium]
LLFMLMLVGACAGSTGGGIKVSRILILIKGARNEIRKLVHPRGVSVVTFNGRRVDDSVIRLTFTFFITYVLVFIASTLLISLDTYDFTSNVSGVIATLNNIGPGLEVVGATGNYGGYSDFSKLVFSLNMLLGRLEIFPLLLALTPASWKR